MSVGECLVIMLVALFVIPPKQWPETARKLAKLSAELNQIWLNLRLQMSQYFKMLSQSSPDDEEPEHR